MRYDFFIILLATLLSGTLAAELKPQARMAILRGLIAEYASPKVALPRGEKGLVLKANGDVDQDSLVREITQNGTAIPANALTQITGIEFHNKEIVFEINGGGKHKTKWYEHIEVGMGSRTTPITKDQNPATPKGSMITLVFPSSLPDLTVDDLKEHLEPVLDFNPPTALQVASRPIPPEFQKAIEAKQAVVGMDQDMVLAALGPPDRKVRETKEGVEQEDWIYGTPPLKVTFVTFEEDNVVDVQEYVGGIRGATQAEPEEPPR
jgi:hypothetical protein